MCGIALTDAVRQHLISCRMVAHVDTENLVAQTRALLETNAMVRKDAQQQRDTAQRLRAEAEAERQKRDDKLPRRSSGEPEAK